MNNFTPAQHAQEALACIKSGDVVGAIEHNLHAIGLDANQPPRVYADLGHQLLRTNQIDEAESMFQVVCEQSPDRPIGFCGLALVAQRRQHWDQALERWNACLTNFPQQGQAAWHFYRGDALMKLGRYEEAEQVFRATTESYPEKPRGWNGLAKVAQLRKQWEAALEYWNECLRRFPGKAAWHVNRANVLMELRRYEEAEQVFQATTENDTEQSQGLVGLAKVAQHRESPPISPPSDPATRSFNGLYPQSNSSAINTVTRSRDNHPPGERQVDRRGQESGKKNKQTGSLSTDRRERWPMSFGQQRMWMLQQTLSDQATYNMPFAYRLRGPVDLQRLRHGLDLLRQRHLALCTALISHGESLQQQIWPAEEIPLPWEEMDFRAEPEEVFEATVAEFLGRDARRLFDLSQPPLWRARWLRLAEDDHVLMLTFHHSIIDVWSHRVLFAEWSQLYATESQTLSAGLLPELSVHCGEHAAWQRAHLTGESLARQQTYWRDQLKALPPQLELPVSFARPLHLSGCGALHQFQVPVGLAGELLELAREEGVTIFRLMLAAFQVWLHRRTGQNDILVGTPVANRQRPEVKSLVGFCLNTLPIRTRLEASATFRQVLRTVQNTMQSALDHADLPFEQIVEMAAESRLGSRTPLYQVMFVMTRSMPPTWSLEHLEVSPFLVHTGTSNNDLTLTILSEHAAWECNLEYASDLFTEDAVANLAESFLEILRAIVADPDETIDRLSMVSQAERHRLLVEWNATAKDYPLDQCVHELIEAQALRTPERIAVTSGKGMLTYRELNAKANQLAVQLRELGVVRSDCVPVMMGQSLELAISELAVMKCGGAFVPLDPHWPKERIRAVLSEINPRVIVAGAPQVPDGWPVITVVAQNLTGQDQNVNAACDPSDPLYVIFTSGSTGKPKGAINQHVGIVNRFHNMTDRFGCHEDDRILATTAPYYDSAVWQLFWPLVNGAGTVLPPADADLNEILELIAAEKITITDFVPSLFNVLASQLADAPQIRSKLRSVRQLIVGGEEISPDRVFQFKEYFPEIGITNAYGPTETSIGVIFYDIPNEPCNRIPIGKPLHNVRAVIVDRRFALVPTGVSGELCLGGVCVGLGYLNAQEATEAVFVDNPFTELDSGKLYRTGDLARHLPDGNIEYLGRIDSQVKIRGHRIELGEIEKTIRSQPGITAAVAVVRECEPGEKRLFAFLVAETGVRLEGPELRARLAEKLPHYMIPSRFMVISELPLTANGKVDRKVMEAMEAEELTTLAAYVPPRTELEQTLVEIWEALLSRPQISRYDNFFDLGGHSLLALKFISTLQELTGIILPVRMVFESPTPAALAEHLVHLSVANGMGASMEKDAELPMIPEMHPDAARDSSTSINDILARQRVYSRTWKGRRLYPESFIVTHNEAGSRQGIFWCLSSYRAFSQLAKHLGADQPVHGMRSGSHIMNYTEENLRALANYYAGEMTDLQPEGAFLIGGNCQGGRIAHSIAERLLELGRSVTLLILLEHITHLPHGSPVALFFGRESDFNPYTNGKDPETAFRLAYPAGYTVDIISGAHGHLFESPHVESLAAALTSRLPIPHVNAHS